MHKWVLVGAIAGSASATCYYPDGTDAATNFNYQPCGDTNTTYSTCCSFDWGDECLPNGLCNWRGHYDYRAACQNKDWTNCPEVCLGTKSSTWFALNKCGTNEYCCPSSQGTDCCDNGSRTYSLEAPDPGSQTSETIKPSATCYYPDGTDATIDYDYQPCGDSSTTYSTCCYFGEGDECLPNGLCNWRGYYDYRAACQNKDWTNCPEVCLGTKSGTWLALNKCGTNEYCCPSSQGADCCDNGSRTYSLEAPDPGSKSSETAKPTESTSDTISSGFPTVISTTTTQTFNPTAEPSSDSSDKASVPAGAIAGGVVGGVAVIGILILGGLYFFKHRGSKPALSPTSPGIVADIAGSNGPRGSDGEQEEPVVRQVQHPGLAKAEGSAANVYMEADSQPISVAAFAVRRQGESQSAVEEKKAAKHQAQQQSLPEIEGSLGNVYTEADSQPITRTRLAGTKVDEEEKLAKHEVQHNVVNIEGVAGNVCPEADSRTVSRTRLKETKRVEEDRKRVEDSGSVHELA